MPFAAWAKREGVSPSYFTRLVRFSYLAPDITQAILEGRQPRDLTADQLLAHSRLPLAWQEQRTLRDQAGAAGAGAAKPTLALRSGADQGDRMADIDWKPLPTGLWTPPAVFVEVGSLFLEAVG
jgi:hypothetical protein